MATKAEIKAELEAKGIEFTDDMNTAELLALLPEQEEIVALKPAKTGDYSWAVNKIKLNRAIAHARTTLGLKPGAEFDAAVKARYVEMNGLLVEDSPRGKSGKSGGGRVVNTAPNDED